MSDSIESVEVNTTEEASPPEPPPCGASTNTSPVPPGFIFIHLFAKPSYEAGVSIRSRKTQLRVTV
ncbi:hypothetical protein, partial [Bacillus altitudinis]|uniref:hypothetical protein n=1 Tax=Bacillus altitudinis TaxID=293387 RepID=UPI001BCD40CD